MAPSHSGRAGQPITSKATGRRVIGINRLAGPLPPLTDGGGSTFVRVLGSIRAGPRPLCSRVDSPGFLRASPPASMALGSPGRLALRRRRRPAAGPCSRQHGKYSRAHLGDAVRAPPHDDLAEHAYVLAVRPLAIVADAQLPSVALGAPAAKGDGAAPGAPDRLSAGVVRVGSSSTNLVQAPLPPHVLGVLILLRDLVLLGFIDASLEGIQNFGGVRVQNLLGLRLRREGREEGSSRPARPAPGVRASSLLASIGVAGGRTAAGSRPHSRTRARPGPG